MPQKIGDAAFDKHQQKKRQKLVNNWDKDFKKVKLSLKNKNVAEQE